MGIGHSLQSSIDADEAAPERLSLLVIDDDPAQRALIASTAAKAGYEVSQAESCDRGLDLMRRRGYACVTLDLMLEDGDGEDVLRAMAQADYQGHVIVISGMTLERRRAARQLASALGMELLQSFSKPIDLPALRMTLAQLHVRLAGLPFAPSRGQASGPRLCR